MDKQRIKQHWEEHKNVYIAAIGGAAFGALVVLLLRKPQIISVVSPEIKPVFNNINDLGGRMVKIVQNLETKEIFESMTAAAEAEGVSLSTMSRHVHGHRPVLNGTQYKILALSTI